MSPVTPLAVPVRASVTLAAAALAVATATVLWSLAAATPSSAQRDPAPDDPVQVTLVDQTTWVDPDGEIVVRFQLDGEVPGDATVEATVHEPLRSERIRADFEDTLSRDRLGGRLTDPPIELGTVSELDPTSDPNPIAARIPIRSEPQDPDEPERLAIFAAGIHPVAITVHDTDRTYLGGMVTHVVRLPRELPDSTTDVVLVAPLDADPSHLADGSAQVDDAVRASWTAAVTALNAGPDQPVLVAPRPETVAALSATGASLDDILVSDLSDLAAAGGLPATTYVDVDLAGFARAGLDADLDRQLEHGAATLESRLGVEVHEDLWVANRSLTTRGLAALAERGISQVIVHHTLLADPSLGRGGPFTLEAGAAGTVTALATDPLRQQHQGSTGDPRLDAQHLLVDLAIDTFDDGPTHPVVLMIDPDAIDPVFVETLSAGLADAPLLDAVTASEALRATPPDTGSGDGGDRTDPAGRLATDTSPRDLGGLRLDLDLTRLSIDTFTSVFPDSDELTARFEDLLAVLPSRALTQRDRDDYLFTIAVEMETLLDAIGLPERRAITLPARSGTIPLTLTNASDRPAVATIRLDSDKLEFIDGESLEIPLPPGTSTVEVGVRARASGAFPLEIVVESPDGRTELATARYTIRSAAVSGVGLAISIAAILVLGVWWVRTARRARAAHHDAAAT
ncbi:MAG: DUF6049 family protein [Acidimicrobiales bacterium]